MSHFESSPIIGHSPNPEPYSCFTCDYSTKHRHLYEEHTEHCIPIPTSLPRTSTPQLSTVSPQLSKSIPQLSTPTPPLSSLPRPPVCRNYRCDKCGFKSNKARVFLTHKKNAHHENITIFPCDRCEYASKHKHKMLRHRKLVHKDAPPLDEVTSHPDAYNDENQNQLSPASVAKAKNEESEFEMVDEEISFRKDDTWEFEEDEIEEEDNEGPEPTENAYNYIVRISELDQSPIFQCKLCTYTNPYKWKIASHIRNTHMKDSLFKCPECDFVCRRKIEWCVHKTEHSAKTVFSCNECLYRTTMKRNFDRHLARHQNDGPVKCLLCSYSSTGEAAIQRHMAEYHSSPEKEKEMEDLEKEMRGSGQGHDVDPESVYSPLVKEDVPPPMESSSPYECGVCGIDCVDDEMLYEHMELHVDDAPWACSLCPMRYKRVVELNQHTRDAHDRHLRDCQVNEPIRPDLDSNGPMADDDDPMQDEPLNLSTKKAYPDANEPLDLSSPHSNIAGPSVGQPLAATGVAKVLFKGSENLRCNVCSYVAKWPSDLRRHLIVHSMEKRFQCKICKRRYKYQFDLNNHVKKFHGMGINRPKPPSVVVRKPDVNPFEVEGVRPLQNKPLNDESNKPKPTKGHLNCDQCGFTAKYAGELDKHKWIHAGYKPYGCLFCEYRTYWKGDMKKHLKSQHGNEISEDTLLEVLEETFDPEKPKDPIGCEVDQFDQSDAMMVDDYDNQMLAGNHDDVPTMVPYTSLYNTDVSDPGGETNSLDCPHCPFTAEAPSKLKSHIEIHEDLKRFMCVHCGRRSNWMWDVRKHIKRDHHGARLEVLELPEDHARATLHDYLAAQAAFRVQEKQPRMQSLLKANFTNIRASGYSPSEASSGHHSSPNKSPSKARFRPFKCSECGKRSNWKWDLNKHIKAVHPNAELIVMDANEAEATFHEIEEIKKKQIKAKVSPSKENYDTDKSESQPEYIKRLVAEKYRPFKCSKCGKRSNWKWDMNKHVRLVHPGAHMVVLSEEEAKATYHEVEIQQLKQKLQQGTPDKLSDGGDLSDTSPRHSRWMTHNTVDHKKLRKFKCSLCPYRSNFRSDVGRHIRRKHVRKNNGRVVMLDEKEALETLDDYKDTWARKKFVPTPNTSPSKSVRSGTGSTPEKPFIDSSKLLVDEHEVSFPKLKAVLTGISDSMDTEWSNVSNDESHDDAVKEVHLWQCTKCEHQDRTKKNVVDHFKAIHKEPAYKCRQCGHSTQYRNSLVRHCRTHHPKDDFTKLVVELACKMGDLVQVPVHSENGGGSKSTEGDKSKSKENESDGLMYRCSICQMTSMYRHTIMRHIIEKHSNVNASEVIEEFQETKPEKPVKDETKSDKSDKLEKEESDKVEKTDVKTETKTEIKSETETKTETKTEIKTDDIQSVDSDSTKTRHADGKNFTCDVCPYRSNKSALLRIHKSYHKQNPGANYKCQLCPYWVSQMRLLYQHIRMHTQAEGLSKEKLEELLNNCKQPVTPVSPSSKGPGRLTFHCDICPFSSLNKTDFYYHKQFHRHKPSATYKCEQCAYWVAHKRLLTQHMKLHAPGYKNPLRQNVDPTEITESDITDISCIDAVEVAALKQQVIASKITSVVITPEKVVPPSVKRGVDFVKGVIVNTEGEVIASGNIKKQHKCQFCPYTSVRLANVRLHECMHGDRPMEPGKDVFRCKFCDYSVANKGLLTNHMKLHSSQYNPVTDNVNDYKKVKGATGTDEDSSEKDDSGDMSDESDSSDDSDKTVKQAAEKKATDKEAEDKQGASELKPETQEEPEESRVRVKTNLGPDKIGKQSDYYVSYDDVHDEHILEKVVLKKWCCERCPYATMKRTQFEKHVQLHNNKQKYQCEYCDYSVPAYHLLLQHKKLHLLPNPNLICVQSLTNLQNLPEIPADLAAAAGFTDDNQYTKYESLKLLEHSEEFTEIKKSYQCDRCPYANSRRDHLLQHLKFHMIKSEYECPHCDYSVSKTHLLNQHVKVHFNVPGSDMNAFSKPEGEAQRIVGEVVAKVKNTDSKGLGSECQPKKAVKHKLDDADDIPVPIKRQKSDPDSKSGLNETHAQDKQNVVEKMDVDTDDTKPADPKSPDPSNRIQTGHLLEETPVRRKSSDNTRRSRGNFKEGKVEKKEWICKYCDRQFNAKDKKEAHEKLHLYGASH